MNDPAPWSRRDASELERQLLDAARADQVPHALEQRMRQALTGVTAPAAISGTFWPRLSGKLAGWSVVSLAVLGGAAGWQLQRHASPVPPAHETTVSAAEAAEPPAEPAPLAAAPAHAITEPATPRSALAHPPAAAFVGNAHALAPASSTLAREIAVLDRARSLLQRAQPREALEALAQYAQRFTHGTLEPEAEALRIEAWAAAGDQPRAHAHARRFLRTHPDHPLNDRVASLAQ